MPAPKLRGEATEVTPKPGTDDAPPRRRGDVESPPAKGEEEQVTAGTSTTAKPEPETTPQAADEDEDGQVGEDGRIILGANEAAIIKQMEADKRPKHEIGRVRDAFKREIKRRILLKAAEAEKGELTKQIDTLNASLSETAEKATLMPSGPLAEFQDNTALQAKKTKITQYLRWADQKPDDALAQFHDTEKASAAEHFAAYKQSCLVFIEDADEQVKINTAREETRKKVKAAAPALFDPKHADGKLHLELSHRDPRQRPDWDQIVADAARGRKQREEEATGDWKYLRMPLKEKKTAAPANGNGHSNGKDKDKVAAREEYTLPAPKGRLPVTPSQTGENRLDTVMKRASTGGVSMDEILDAQAGN